MDYFPGSDLGKVLACVIILLRAACVHRMGHSPWNRHKEMKNSHVEVGQSLVVPEAEYFEMLRQPSLSYEPGDERLLTDGLSSDGLRSFRVWGCADFVIIEVLACV